MKIRHAGIKRMPLLLCLGLAGCSALLPHGNSLVEGPWESFESAQQTFDQIIPYHTTVEELKALKLDPRTQPNITILNYSDVLRRFMPSNLVSLDNLDAGVRECLNAKTACKGYEVVQKSIKRNRSGNFMSDFLNFSRQVDVTGWSFTGVILTKDNVVIYKLVSGQPLIREQENSSNPLGPLQGAGESAMRSGF